MCSSDHPDHVSQADYEKLARERDQWRVRAKEMLVTLIRTAHTREQNDHHDSA